MLEKQYIIILALVTFLLIPSFVLAASGWEIIWETDYILDEPSGAHEGYFLVDQLENWPNGLLRREIRVEYLEGDDSAGSIITFDVIRCSPEGGWCEWSVGCRLEPLVQYHQCTSFFDAAPTAAGVIYDGRKATGPCYARVNMRLLRPAYRTWLPLLQTHQQELGE